VKVRPETKGINIFSSIENEEICYLKELRFFSFSRFAPLALGLLLFFNAKILSRNLSFQYMGGITCGVGLSALGESSNPDESSVQMAKIKIKF